MATEQAVSERETTYAITTTNGAYLREVMRRATSDNVEAVLVLASAYIGVEGEIEHWDDGRIVLGPLCATPVGM
jgi:hypothetical protein